MIGNKITLTPTYERPYIIGQYLQSRNLPINKNTIQETNEAIEHFLSRISVDKNELHIFLDRCRP